MLLAQVCHCSATYPQQNRINHFSYDNQSYVGFFLLLLPHTGHLTTGTANQLLSTREMSLTFLADQIERMTGQSCDLTGLRVGQGSKETPTVVSTDGSFGIEPFFIPRGTRN